MNIYPFAIPAQWNSNSCYIACWIDLLWFFKNRDKMIQHTRIKLKQLLWISGFLTFSSIAWTQQPNQQDIENIVNQQFKPLLEQHQITGMAVAITWHGKHYFINYGMASQQDKQPVNSQTLFELGSVSKIFNATLAGYAHTQGKLSLTAHPATYFPQLKNTAINQVTVLHLGTYTAGGLPLQFPRASHSTTRHDKVFSNMATQTPHWNDTSIF